MVRGNRRERRVKAGDQVSVGEDRILPASVSAGNSSYPTSSSVIGFFFNVVLWSRMCMISVTQVTVLGYECMQACIYSNLEHLHLEKQAFFPFSKSVEEAKFVRIWSRF